MGIEAGGIEAAWFVHALINVMATDIGIAGESLRTDTSNAIGISPTFGIGTTAIGFTCSLALGTTTLIGIAGGTRVANTLSTAKAIFTVGIETAGRITFGIFNGWHANQIGIANKVGLTHAFATVLVTHSTDAAHNAITSLLAAAINTDLSFTAGS